MSVNFAGYETANNEPLRNARILWDALAGTVTADGSDGALALNDFAFQRWQVAATGNTWVMLTAATALVDTVFVDAHSLPVGATVVVATNSAATGGTFVTRATLTVAEKGECLAAMFSTVTTGAAYSVRRVRLTVNFAGDGPHYIGIIRAGVALQMARSFFGGHTPLRFDEELVMQSSETEQGQPLGRTVQRNAYQASPTWRHLEAQWVRDNWEPFRRVAMTRGFGLIENAQRMPESVGWCWAMRMPVPVNMGIRDYMEVSLQARALANRTGL